MTKKDNDNINMANAIFHNTDAGRAVFSNKFNYIYDNESGVAISYGKAVGDTAPYDPIGPEEYIIETDDFDLNKFKKMFNMFAVVKAIDADKQLINPNEMTTEDQLVSMSTISNIIFKIADINLLSNNDFKEFIRYIEIFKLQPVLMIDYLLVNDNTAFIIKELGKNISVILTVSSFDKKHYDKIIEQLIVSNIFYALKVNLSKNNFNEIKALLMNVSNDISVTLSCIDPFIDRKSYRDIQEICLNRELTNVSLSACHSVKFNRKTNNLSIIMQKCSAGTYSAYVKNGKIAPCEFFTTNFVNLDECKTIHDFWYHPFFKAARKTVIKQKSCNK